MGAAGASGGREAFDRKNWEMPMNISSRIANPGRAQSTHSEPMSASSRYRSRPGKTPVRTDGGPGEFRFALSFYRYLQKDVTSVCTGCSRLGSASPGGRVTVPQIHADRRPSRLSHTSGKRRSRLSLSSPVPHDVGSWSLRHPSRGHATRVLNLPCSYRHKKPGDSM